MPNGYSFIFSSIVQNDNDFVGMVAYTLYKRQKIEWIAQFIKDHNNTHPTDAEVEDGFAKFSNMPSQINAYREQAVDLLDAFLDEALYEQVIDARLKAKDDAVVRAVKKSFWASIGENLVAGLLSSLITLGAAGLIWVAAKGPENLLREAIQEFGATRAAGQIPPALGKP